MSAARFAVEYAREFGEISLDFPHFDCRVISMPSITEATNMLLWRELDARKNAVSMAARHFFSHRELQGKSSKEMTEMMLTRGQSMDDYPASFTRGTWIKRTTSWRELSDEERSVIPEKHQPAAGTMFERSTIDTIKMPPFSSVTNRERVVFGNEQPTA
jgi:tRNA(His) 5'-end guanylyltransferase